MCTARATAAVATPTPERYAKQLASHLGRRVEVLEEDRGPRLLIGEGSCALVSTEGVLTLEAEAPSEEMLERIMDVVGSHLVRFGQRNELVVEWVR